MDGRHGFGFEQGLHEIVVGGDDLALRRLLADQLGDGRINVEGAFRHRAFQALGLVQHRDNEVAATLEGGPEHRQVLLCAVQRFHRRPLADGAGAGGLLALHHVHGIHQMLRACRVADAPAGHGIGFRHAVHGQRAVIEIGLDLGGRAELEVAIGEVLVHVVGEDPDMRMLHQDIGQRLHLGPAIGRARGVGGRVEDHPLRLRRDGALEILGLELEVGFLLRLDEDRGAAAQRHHLGVAHPVGRHADHLVARVQRGKQGVVDHMLAARGHDGLRGLVVEIVLALELAGHRLAQRLDAGDGRVLCLAPADGVDGGVLDVVGRVEIRLADRKRNHVPAGRLEVPRLLRDDDGRGRLHALQRVGEKGHGSGSGWNARRTARGSTV